MSANENVPLQLLLDLVRNARVVTAEVDRVLGPAHGIALNDLELLLEIAQSPENALQVGELSRRLGIASSDVVRRVVPHERIGVVERLSHPSDPRQTLVRLTAGGSALVVDALQTAGETSFESLGRRWTDPQQSALRDLLIAGLENSVAAV